MADRVLDYSAGFPGAAAIKAAGYAGAVRYIGLPGNPKNTTGQELDDFRAHELGMALVFERVTTDWRMGYAGGQSFGRQARDHANTIGFPADRPIYMAVDQQVVGLAEHDTAMNYLHGAANVLGGKALTGVYGQASICARARTEGFGYRWQTKAWSAGVVAAGIHLLQNIGYVYVGGLQCDTNEVLQADWGQDGESSLVTTQIEFNQLMDGYLDGKTSTVHGEVINLKTAVFKAATWAGDARNIAENVDDRTAGWEADDGTLRVSLEMTPQQIADLAAGIQIEVPSPDGTYTLVMSKTS
jgi:hypothetical protein